MKTILRLSLFLALVGCGESAPPVVAPTTPPVENGASAVTVERVAVTHLETEPQAAPPPPAPPPVQVVSIENSPISGPNPELRITSPHDGARVRAEPVQLHAILRNWSLAPDPGNHVHVIVDNEPYIAVRDLSQPIDLSRLVRENLHHDLAPGSHVVRMFPSRPTHESVKTPGAFVATTFFLGTPTPGFSFNAAAPLLTFSRPKGCNVAGTRVLLDFYLANVAHLAADGFRVRYTIDGTITGDITSWTPHFIENLPEGSHTVRLQLIGANGEPVPGMFNDTTRTITVAASCTAPGAPADPHAGH